MAISPSDIELAGRLADAARHAIRPYFRAEHGLEVKDDASPVTLADKAAEAAMRRYLAWLKALPGKPVFVGYPAGYDFLFVYWYLMRFAGESPFSHSALDIKSFAMAMLKTDYRSVTKRSMPKRWFDRLPHTHVALDDAIEQGALFCNMLAENRG